MSSNNNLKQILISILIGAVIAFLTSLIDGLAEFLKNNATALISGGATTAYYAIKNTNFL